MRWPLGAQQQQAPYSCERLSMFKRIAKLKRIRCRWSSSLPAASFAQKHDDVSKSLEGAFACAQLPRFENLKTDCLRLCEQASLNSFVKIHALRVKLLSVWIRSPKERWQLWYRSSEPQKQARLSCRRRTAR
jgi:hypothetical protein